MSYEKQNFVDGQVLKAEHLNHIEAGIEAVEESVGEIVDIVSVEQTTTSDESGGTNIITVTLSDGNTGEFEVKNGKDGVDGGPGDDGSSIHYVRVNGNGNSTVSIGPGYFNSTPKVSDLVIFQDYDLAVIVDVGSVARTSYIGNIKPDKGTDYYTEDDKAEMVNAVLAALPTWTGGSY